MAMGQGRIKPRLFPVLFSGNGSPQLIPSLLFHTWDNFEGGSLRKKNVPVKLSKCPSSFNPPNQKIFFHLVIQQTFIARCQVQCQESKLNPCSPEDSF